jgi:2-keto-4-pentenoate hydratase/2-oxohepta-3-ene-1,7-dioic acid hydratase in catechol pathway
VRYARVTFGGTAYWAELTVEAFALLDASPLDGGRPTGALIAQEDADLLAPVTPSKIYCVGRNYAAHRVEMGYGHNGTPSVFMKGPTTIIGPHAAIELPPATLSSHIEHEAELAVVIGKPAKAVAAANAADYIFGYTCANDVSARDLQRSDPQPTRAKGFDTFCPVGPWIDTDIDPTNGVRLRCWVNDELRQDAQTSDMTYPVPFLIEYLSAFATLLPGDLILTGSPAGTTPIHDGDHVAIAIDGIGTLTNRVLGAAVANSTSSSHSRSR